ncbi:hypothetical protein [Streptomyces sp. HP-A2021]|uniref:hypothetical protein n=1 Tax=Streptomyces sp. HP-A2021 TaxID=2927875 RepID=UPI0024356CD9|nr:hypothetical protein [Streptomyces sp. HP-A2021]
MSVQPGSHYNQLAVLNTGGHLTLTHFIFIIQNPDEAAFIAHLYGVADGATTAFFSVSTFIRIFTNWFGNRASSRLSKRALSLIVLVVEADLVIHAQQDALRKYLLIGAIPCRSTTGG